MLDVNQLYCAYHIDLFARTIIVSFFSLFLFRIGNTRLFSQLAAYDLIVFIILGALLGNAIIDEKLFIASLICCLIITGLHRFFGYLSAKFVLTNKFLKGQSVILYNKKGWIDKNLIYCSLNKADIYQELRNAKGINSLSNIYQIIMEGNGKISFLTNDEK